MTKLTLTALDTQGLRLWISRALNREKRYALLTMPEFGRIPALLGEASRDLRRQLRRRAGGDGLRTDHFTGPLGPGAGGCRPERYRRRSPLADRAADPSGTHTRKTTHT